MKRRTSARLAALLFIFSFFTATSVFAWTGPTGTAPANNTASPIDVSATSQTKAGNLSVGTLSASSVGATVGFCIGASCITSWPSGGTSQWTTSGSNIYYNSGNVLIGATSPYATYDRLTLYNAAGPYTYLRIAAPLANQSAIAFNDDTNGQDSVIYRPGASRDLVFYTSGAGNVMYVTQAGNVGIGTGSPGQKLDVQGAINETGGITDTAGTRMDGGGGWVRTYGSSGWYNNTYSGGWYMQDPTWIRSYGSKAVYMDTGFDTGAASGVGCGGGLGGGFQFRVCGTAQVASVLQVNGPANDWATKSISSGPYGLYTANSSGYYVYEAYSSWGIYTNGNILGSGIYGGAFYYNSDRRLKKNIETIPNNTALEDVLNLNGVTFDWIDPKAGTGKQIGFIAQDVEKVVPELVTTNSSTTMKAVDYARVTALLVNAMKEQQKQIDDLKAEVSALKNK